MGIKEREKGGAPEVNLQKRCATIRFWRGFSSVLLVNSSVSRRFPRFHLKIRASLTQFTSRPSRSRGGFFFRHFVIWPKRPLPATPDLPSSSDAQGRAFQQ